MKCPNCGIENAEEAKFCTDCGSALSDMSSDEITQIMDSEAIKKFLIKDRFRIMKKLGAGGMGEVLLAEDLKLKRNVAIKSILTTGHGDTSSKIRFLREAQTASKLDHTNICTIYEIYEEEDKEYIVMQFIDGITLDHIIGVKKLGIEKIIDISLQMCHGMQEAHANDVIHRDIKPGNLMIDKKGTVKILDFGLAKFTDESSDKSGSTPNANLTEKGFVMGTVAYISPEQAKGKTLDQRSDIFSFGVVLYEMIEGVNPFKCEEQIETLYNVLNKDVEFQRDIPDALKTIVRKTLAKEKEDRYPDFPAIIADLEALRSTYVGANATGPLEQSPNGHTEIIDIEEKAELLEIGKTSDKEDLGAMVSRIKKFKASTERVAPTTLKKVKFLWGIPLVLLLLVAAYFFLLSPGPPPPVQTRQGSYIYIQPFENKTNTKHLPEMLEYLLMESLGQLDGSNVINRQSALSILGKDAEEIDFERLKKDFGIDIQFQLNGKITRSQKFYIIDASLDQFHPESGKIMSTKTITSTGEGLNSMLDTHVDTLARGIYQYLFPEASRTGSLTKTSGVFSGKWNVFSNFYAGINFHEKFENNRAEEYFKNAGESLIAKYYLADLYFFDGSRVEARQLIDEIKPKINALTPDLQLKTRVMDARLKFEFQQEHKYLEELEKRNPHSSEVKYLLGEAFFHIADPDNAIPYYEAAIRLNQSYSKAINHLGYCYAYKGDTPKALEMLQKYRELDESRNSFDSLGDGHFFAGNLTAAESMKSLAVQPDNKNHEISWPYQTLCDIYVLKASYDEARNALNQYLRLRKSQKDKGYGFRQRAFIQYENENYEQALKHINSSLETYKSDNINDNTPEDYWHKGRILLKLDRAEEAKAQLQELEKFKDKYNLTGQNFKAAYKYYLHLDALIAESENRTDDAENRFKALMTIKNRLSYWITYYNYQYFHTQYAAFLVRREQYGRALDEIEECLKFNNVDFPYIPALWVKAEALEKQGKSAEAKEVYRKLEERYGPSQEKNTKRNRLKEKLAVQGS